MDSLSFEQRTGRENYTKQLKKEIKALLDPCTGMLDSRYSANINCPLCEEENFFTLFTKSGYTFVQCENCGLIYTNPMVLADKVQEAYRFSMVNELWIEVLLNKENQAWQKKYFTTMLDKIEEYSNRGKLLDIGCSIGLFMKLAEKRGWETHGIELGERAFKYCKDSGLNVNQKLLEECEFHVPFQTITAFGLLEHVNDPITLLSKVRENLSNDGLLAVIVPNVFSLATMILREKSTTFDGRNHLLYFSLETIKYLFKKCGFEIVHLDTMTTAVDNITKYSQYLDPYGSDERNKFLPVLLKDILYGEKKENMEKFILENDLGFHIRVIAKSGECSKEYKGNIQKF